VPESHKLKRSVSQPGIKSLSHCPRFGTSGKNGLKTRCWFHCSVLGGMRSTGRSLVTTTTTTTTAVGNTLKWLQAKLS